MKRIILALLTLAITLPAHSAPIQRYFESVRALGMGGAFTAVANDENALFYNPAGLTRVEKFSFAVLNPLFETNGDTLDFAEDFNDIDSDNTAEVTGVLRKYIGEPIHARVSVFPYFVTSNFGLGLLARTEVDATVHNMANPEVDVDANASVGVHAAYAHAFDNLSVGLGLKLIQGGSLQKTYEAADIASDNFSDKVEDDLENETGIGADIGAMYKFDVMFEPRVAVAVINAVEPGIGSSDAYKRHVNIGFSGTYKLADMVDLTAALDFVDVLTNLSTDEDYAKRINMGLEAKLPYLLTLRAGLNQGYPSLGATLDFWVLKLSYARYFEEIGPKAGDHSDLRHLVQLSLGW